ncbi:MAG: helix-turn-helix transcriptional regulator, partial [Streptomycetales bacterium]
TLAVLPSRTRALHLALAQVAADRHQPDAAWARLRLVHAAGGQGPPDPAVEVGIAPLHAQLACDRGDRQAAVAVLMRCREQGRAQPAALDGRIRLAAAEAEVEIACGRPDHALEILEHLAASRAAPCLVVRGRAALAAGDPRRARREIGPLLAGLDGEPRVGVEAWLLDALASSSVGEPLRARRSLEVALDAAAPDGLRRPFLLVAPWLRQMLDHGADLGARHGWLTDGVTDGDVMTTLRTPAGQPTPGRPTAFVDPLTGQERAVLRQLAAMLSNEEIAAEMHLSVNTVKTHLKSAYRKLGVSRRRQAVRRSRELHLL